MKERKKEKQRRNYLSTKTHSHKHTRRMRGNSSTARSGANVKVQFTFTSVRCRDRQIAWSHDGARIACVALILETKEEKLSQLYLERNILLKNIAKNLLTQDQGDLKSKWILRYRNTRMVGSTAGRKDSRLWWVQAARQQLEQV